MERSTFALGRVRDGYVAAMQLDLIGGHQRLGQQLEDAGLKLREREREWHQQALALDGREHELHQLLEAARFRPAELVDLTIFRAALNRRNDRARDTAGEYRLEPGMPAPG